MVLNATFNIIYIHWGKNEKKPGSSLEDINGNVYLHFHSCMNDFCLILMS